MAAPEMTSPVTRTVFTVEVVHRTDQPLPTLTDALDAIANGDAIGTTTSLHHEYLDVSEVDGALRNLGANGGFFDDYLQSLPR